MANKANKPAKTPEQIKEDAVVYKAAIDLGILLIAFYLISYLNKAYPTNEGFFIVQPITLWVTILSAIAAVGCAVVAFIRPSGKKKAWIVCAVILFALALCALSLNRLWMRPLPIISLLVYGACILYLIYLLYPLDFTVIAFLTGLTGYGFYLHDQRCGVTRLVLAIYAVSCLLCIAAIILAGFAAKRSGKLTVGKYSFRLYDGAEGPIPLYLTGTLWIVCIAAALIVGSTFAHYGLYAAGGFAFIAACYYTINLN